MTDKEMFYEFRAWFPSEADAIKYAPDANETLTYRYMYRAFVFGFKAGQRKEITQQNEERK